MDKQQRMYSTMSNLVLGFHGCNKDTYRKVLLGSEILHESKNSYDWLGNGMYFWEQDISRAWQWANHHYPSNPAVIGAVIDMGYCLNFLDSRSIALLRDAYEIFQLKRELTESPQLFNKNVKNNNDLLLRFLDCAVIQDLHEERKIHGLRDFDTVRGLFQEGKPIYETSGFREKTHIQICVRNPNCIKGFFSPRNIDVGWNIV